MALSVTRLNYPIYSVAYGEKHIITSGGGGGQMYGIENLMEVHSYSSTDKRLNLEFTTLEQNGVIDSLVYSDKLRLWAGCVESCILIFYIREDVGPVILHNFRTEDEESNLRQSATCFSPNGEYLVSGGDNKCLSVWKLNIIAMPEIRKSATTSEAKGQAINPAKLDPSKPTERIHLLTGHQGNIKDCTISNDSKLLVSCASDCTLKVWNIRDGTLLASQSHNDPRKKSEKLILRCCNFLSTDQKPPGYTLLSVGCANKGPSYAAIWLLQEASGSIDVKLLRTLYIDDAPCTSLAVSRDEEYYAIGFSSGKCKVLNNRLQVVCGHSTHDLPVTGTCFIEGENAVVSSGADYNLTVMRFKNTRRPLWKKLLSNFLLFIILLLLMHLVRDLLFSGLEEHINSWIPVLTTNSPSVERIRRDAEAFGTYYNSTLTELYSLPRRNIEL